MKKRILLLLTVAVVMVAMMLTMAMPAFAGNAYARGQNNSNYGSFHNDFIAGDHQNNFAGSKNYGYSLAYGDFRN
jgi:hypothetical protein